MVPTPVSLPKARLKASSMPYEVSSSSNCHGPFKGDMQALMLSGSRSEFDQANKPRPAAPSVEFRAGANSSSLVVCCLHRRVIIQHELGPGCFYAENRPQLYLNK